MRKHGILSKWNDERGFGFITTAQGATEIFVHISDFPKDGIRPTLNETISFETEIGDNDKIRAIRVMRPDSYRRKPRKTLHQSAQNGKNSIFSKYVSILFILILCLFGYHKYQDSQTQRLNNQAAPLPKSTQTAAPTEPSNPIFRCDGREHCSQMTSCAEAKYFISNCPNTKMDGDGDGIPCERDSCASSW